MLALVKASTREISAFEFDACKELSFIQQQYVSIGRPVTGATMSKRFVTTQMRYEASRPKSRGSKRWDELQHAGVAATHGSV